MSIIGVMIKMMGTEEENTMIDGNMISVETEGDTKTISPSGIAFFLGRLEAGLNRR
jgi:hypothetical protein